MILELDDDFSDEIVVANLAQSYVGVSEMLKDKHAHEDDIDAWIALLPALKLVGGWYSVDFDKDIKKAKKRK